MVARLIGSYAGTQTRSQPAPSQDSTPSTQAAAASDPRATTAPIRSGPPAVPESAIQTVEGRPSVFVPVAGEENTFAARPVVAGPAVGGMVPIFEGLEAGEQIVVAGSFILKAELGKGSAAPYLRV